MPRSLPRARAGVGTLVLLGACSQLATDATGRQASALASAFASVPIGFGAAQSSFDATAEGAWAPPRREGRGGFGGMMGRGLGGDFLGGDGFGHGHGRGPFGVPGFSCSGTFDASTGRISCSTETRNGLAVTRWVRYTTAAGTAQSAFDTATTNTVQSHVQVTGTVTRRDGDTSAVSHVSDRTVSGLASGSTKRTVDGTSAGTETTIGKDSAGVAFTATRVVGDTTSGVTIPTPTSANTRPYPTAGTVIRHMKVTVTRSGATSSSERREVITFDGSSTAKVTITRDGTTTTCTIPLPHGRPTCQ